MNPITSRAEPATEQSHEKFNSNDKRKPFWLGIFLEHGGHARAKKTVFLQMASFLGQRRAPSDGEGPGCPSD